MKLKSIILGIAMTAVLLGVLVATRMMVLTTSDPQFEIREIDTTALPEPPPPEPEPSQAEDIPPPPALADLSVTQDVTMPAIPISNIKVDPRLAVDTFFTDQPPSPLPVVRKPKSRPAARVQPKSPPRPRTKPAAPKPRQKSQYSLGELDKKPRLLRNPSVTFPRSIKTSSRGRVVVRVAILPSGKSRYLSTISSTHPALNSLARRIANGSRFTPPTRHGKPVKATMTWPIIIKK